MTLTLRARQAPPLLLFHSCFQAWCGVLRDPGVFLAEQDSQDGLRTRVWRITFSMRRVAQAAEARARKQYMAQASTVHRKSCVQRGWADRQPRRVWTQQAFVAQQVVLGQRCEAHQLSEERARAWARMALCWALWVCKSHYTRSARLPLPRS